MSASAGVFHPRVLRGRVLSARATAARSSAECRDRSLFGAFGEVLTQQAVGVLVAATLPGAVRVAEVDRQAGVDAQLRVLGHLRSLVPGKRAAQLLGQRRDRRRDRVTHRLCTVTGQRGAVLDGGLLSVAVHAGQVQQHGEPCRALDERTDRRAAQPEDEIALPMAGNGAFIGFGGPLTDHDLGGDELLAATRGFALWAPAALVRCADMRSAHAAARRDPGRTGPGRSLRGRSSSTHHQGSRPAAGSRSAPGSTPGPSVGADGAHVDGQSSAPQGRPPPHRRAGRSCLTAVPERNHGAGRCWRAWRPWDALARRSACHCAVVARYSSLPLCVAAFRRTSREIVDGARRSRRAIARPLAPWARRMAISSRSANDR